jgi:hypothetical protein
VSSANVVPLADVWAMLDACAPGHHREEHGDHKWDVRFGARRFPRLPVGAHGRGRHTGRAEIYIGHIRKLVRTLEITECARGFIPGL